MAKTAKKPVVNKVASAVKSTLGNAVNIGYRFASNLQSNTNLVKELITLYPNIINEVPKELEQDLKAGIQMRYSENNPQHRVTYIHTQNGYIPAGEGKTKSDKLHMTVAFAMSYSSQAFGQLKTSNPSLYDIVNAVRRPCGLYVTRTYNTFTALIKSTDNDMKGVEKTHSPTKAFEATVDKALSDLIKKCKCAKVRGDITADEARFTRAIKAFKKEWTVIIPKSV